MIGNYPPPFGGVPTHIMYVSQYMAEHGWDVHIYPQYGPRLGVQQVGEHITVHRPPTKAILGCMFKGELTTDDVCTPMSLWKDRKAYLSATANLRYIESLCANTDMKVISAYHILGAGTLGAVLARKFKLPMITTVFGEVYERTTEHWRKIDEVKLVHRHTNRWIAPSNHCAKSMALLDLPDIDKADTFYHGIDTKRFKPDNDGSAIREKFGIAPDAPLALFVGRMKAAMGIDVLMQAVPMCLRRRPDMQFIFAGGKQRLTKDAVAMAKRLPKNVYTWPNVPDEDLPGLYAAADIGVAPSVNQRACLGLAIAEAMASGCAVIGSRVGGTGEVMPDGKAGRLITPGDPFDLADTVIDMISDPQQLQSMGAFGREHIVANFDATLINQNFEKLVSEVIEQGSISRPGI